MREYTKFYITPEGRKSSPQRPSLGRMLKKSPGSRANTKTAIWSMW